MTKALCYELAETESDSRGRWRVIKELLHSDSSPPKGDPADNQHICDAFAAFFADLLTKTSIKVKDIVLSGSLSHPVIPVCYFNYASGEVD